MIAETTSQHLANVLSLRVYLCKISCHQPKISILEMMVTRQRLVRVRVKVNQLVNDPFYVMPYMKIHSKIVAPYLLAIYLTRFRKGRCKKFLKNVVKSRQCEFDVRR